MQFIDSKEGFPFSSAVIHGGKVLEAVLTGIPKGEKAPVAGGPGAEMREIFSQLDSILAQAGLSKKISARRVSISSTSTEMLQRSTRSGRIIWLTILSTDDAMAPIHNPECS